MNHTLTPRAERATTRGTTLLVLTTALGALFAFLMRTGQVMEPFATTFDWSIILIVLVNGVASLAVVLYVRRHLAGMDPMRAFTLGFVGLASIAWDVVALGILLFTKGNPGLYLYAGIVMIVDLATDVYVEHLRTKPTKEVSS